MRRLPEYFWSEFVVIRSRYIPIIFFPSFVALSRVVFVVLMPSEMNVLFTEPEYLSVCLLTSRFTQIDELIPAPKPALKKAEPKPVFKDYLGWHKQDAKKWFVGLPLLSGRLKGHFKKGLRK